MDVVWNSYFSLSLLFRSITKKDGTAEG